MANEVIITVKVNNQANFAPIATAVAGMGAAATRASSQVSTASNQAKAALASVGTAATQSSGHVSTASNQARNALGQFAKQAQSTGAAVSAGMTHAAAATTTAAGQARNALGQFVSAGGSASASASKLSQAWATFGSAFNSNLSGTAGSISGFIANVQKMGAGLAVVNSLGEAAGTLLSNLPGILAACASAAAGAAAAFAALGPALLAAGGAAGAAATLFAGAGIALGTLKIGFGGIGDALAAHTKQMNAAGGAAKKSGEDQYQAAKRIKDATQALADAKERESDAAKDVNKARADEIDRLRELDLALRGQKISQAEAAQALIEAKEKARRADMAGSDWEKAEAHNAVARAQLEYDSTTEKLSDLTAEKKKATKVGVEGSDQVQTALKREADAHKAVLKAQEQLADAHHKTAVAAGGAAGGINAFDQAMQKLSPNAQSLVKTLIHIQDQFSGIKKRVQDRLLDGFSKSVQDLADKWMPHLDDILGNMADHLNSFGKNLMSALGDDTFIKNIETAGKATGSFVDNLSGAADAFVDAFGRLAASAAPVLGVIGKWIEKIFVAFDKWIKSADNSGKLKSFMDDAAKTLDKIFTIGSTVVKIIGQFIKIIFPDSKKAGDSVLDGVQDVLNSISAWLADPKHQADIKHITEKVTELVEKFMKNLPKIIKLGGDLFDQYVSGVKKFEAFKAKVETVLHALGAGWDWIKGKVSSFFNWIGSSATSIGNKLGGIWHGLENGFKNAINAIIRGWNSLQFTIGGGSFAGISIPSASFGTPNIPYLAHGGISGGLAMVGERGRELVRLPQGSTVIPNGTTESMMSQSGGGSSRLMLGFDRASGTALQNVIIDMMQNYVRKRGGNVQVALGRTGAGL